ncbi:TPA: hypothetical protein HA246_03625 [Candidatus Woesearchaeota archaeon]|nr:hypothetical protein [Candidatus Woesearchaeota archaeon]
MPDGKVLETGLEFPIKQSVEPFDLDTIVAGARNPHQIVIISSETLGAYKYDGPGMLLDIAHLFRGNSTGSVYYSMAGGAQVVKGKTFGVPVILPPDLLRRVLEQNPEVFTQVRDESNPDLPCSKAFAGENPPQERFGSWHMRHADRNSRYETRAFTATAREFIEAITGETIGPEGLSKKGMALIHPYITRLLKDGVIELVSSDFIGAIDVKIDIPWDILGKSEIRVKQIMGLGYELLGRKIMLRVVGYEMVPCYDDLDYYTRPAVRISAKDGNGCAVPDTLKGLISALVKQYIDLDERYADSEHTVLTVSYSADLTKIPGLNVSGSRYKNARVTFTAKNLRIQPTDKQLELAMLTNLNESYSNVRFG